MGFIMRGIKLIMAGSLLIAMPAFAETITCVSVNNAFTRCDLTHADQYNVQVKNVTTGTCAANAWGSDSKGVWVKDGCGAVFQYSQNTARNTTSNVNNSQTPYYYDEPYYDEPYYYYDPDYFYYYPGGIFFYENGNNGYHHYYNNHQNYHDGQYHGDGYHGDGYHGQGGVHGGSGGFHGGGGGGGFHGGGGHGGHR